MTLNQILRRIRRQPAEPELTAEQRALVEQWNTNVEGWTPKDFADLDRSMLDRYGDEIKQAYQEIDELRAQRHSKR